MLTNSIADDPPLIKRRWTGQSRSECSQKNFPRDGFHCNLPSSLVFSSWLLIRSGAVSPQDTISFPKYSVYLSHVCSCWRQPAHASSEATPALLNQRLLARAQVYTHRASQSPLDIHIGDSHAYSRSEDFIGNSPSFSFLSQAVSTLLTWNSVLV
jgi:hypothetical protein